MKHSESNRKQLIILVSRKGTIKEILFSRRRLKVIEETSMKNKIHFQFCKISELVQISKLRIESRK